MKKIEKELRDCILCYDAPCSRACPKYDTERIFRAYKFDNIKAVAAETDFTEACKNCSAPCETACRKKVSIRSIIRALAEQKEKFEQLPVNMNVDISCDVCGVRLENPFLLSSSVVGSKKENNKGLV